MVISYRGSKVMYQHNNFLKLFPIKVLHIKSRNSGLPSFKDAGINYLNLYIIFALPITILDRTFEHKIWVFYKITDSIIGEDIINIYNLSYDILSKSVHCRNISHQPTLTLEKEANSSKPNFTVTKMLLNLLLQHLFWPN